IAEGQDLAHWRVGKDSLPARDAPELHAVRVRIQRQERIVARLGWAARVTDRGHWVSTPPRPAREGQPVLTRHKHEPLVELLSSCVPHTMCSSQNDTRTHDGRGALTQRAA